MLFISNNKKNGTKTEKDKKTWKKKITHSWKRLQGKWDNRFNSLKPSEFEPKTNFGDINSSSSDNEEEGSEYKVKWISNSKWYECSNNAVVGRCSSK